MQDFCFRVSLLGVFLLIVLTTTPSTAQRPEARITQRIDPNQRVTLHGNTHPLARAEFDRGPAPDSTMADRMMLVLSRSDEQEKALRQLLDEQHTAGSPNFHKWLTPEEFGRQFGPSDTDIQTVTTWLLNSGFQVTSVSPGRNVIEFSGTAEQLRQAFHTDLHKFVVKGQEHWANANDPQIPAALAPVVEGIAALNNFGRQPQSHSIRPFKLDTLTGEASPLVTTGGSPAYYLLGPGDFSVIYNSQPLIQAGNDGTGQKIAIAGRTNINLQDVTDFRNFFGLPNTPNNHTSVILNGPDPGIVDVDETEALLDVEWAGAVAPGTQIVLVSTESTLTGDGVDLSALYIVENNLAPVMSVSYGSCEAALGNGGNLFYQSLWEQAAAQGITVNVAAGDNGSAGCDDPNTETLAQYGTAVNGIASTPFNIAVGGTDFNDSNTQTTYFNNVNASGSWTSAKSYIPEMPWNDSCAGGISPTTGSCTNSSKLQLWAGSGGPSNCSKVSGSTCSGTAKPSWQSGTGVPSDGVRDIPDISLFAASGTAGSRSLYIICEADLVSGPSCQNPGPGGGNVYLATIGGTSASSPAFAGAVALANQKVGHRLGNLNYLLYSIAAQSGNSCPSSSSTSGCVFHDVTVGGNSVPCKGGSPKCSASTGNGVLVDSGKLAYLSGTGYDRATGLGTPNINNLVTKIAAASFTPTTTTLTLNGGTAQVNASHGQSINVAVGVSPSAATGDVSLIGNNATSDNSGFDFFKLTSGAASWSSTLFPGGSYTVHAHYAGDGSRGASDSGSISVNISPENSKTFVNLVTFDLSGHLLSFSGTAAEYGSPYILRMDVGDSAATISSSTGVSSKCVNGTASCPTGTLTVTANGNPLDGGSWKLNNLGHSEEQPIQLPPGSYNIVANYPGDASYNASSGSTNVSISKATTTLTTASGQLPPYQYGSLVDVGAWLTTQSNGAAPTGTFSFFDNGSPITPSALVYEGFPGHGTQGATLTAGGSYPFSVLGAHSLTSTYSGDGNYAAAGPTAPFNLNVVQGPTYFNNYGVIPNQATPAMTVSLTVDVFTNSSLNEPTGTVTFYDNGTPLNGTVTYTGHSGSWNNPGGGNYIAVLSAKMPYIFTQAGTHNITATYSGDTYYISHSQQIGTLTVYSKLPTTLQPTSSLQPALVNYPTNLTATVGVPNISNLPNVTGTITFSENGQQLSGTVTYTTTYTGYGSYTLTATMPYTFTTSGTHNISANYSGDSTFASAAGSLTLSVVDKYTTSIPYLNVYNIAVNQPSNISLDVNSDVINQGPMMTGTVTITDGNTSIPDVTLASQYGYLIASAPYTFTTAGTHSITVQYSGDDHYAASSKTFQQDILGVLAVRLQSNNLTMPATGGSGSAYLNVYNTTNSPMTVALSCQSSSTSATCSVTPANVTIPANSINGPTVTFTVPALSSSNYHYGPFRSPFVFAGLLAALCVIRFRKRELVAVTLALILCMFIASCGGGSGSSGGGGGGGGGRGQTSATYKFTITGTSGSNTDSQVLTVTVQR